MQKVVIRRPGSFRRLEIVTERSPAALAGEALVEVRSVGVNFADCVVRMGLYPSAREYVGWPITPGFEFAGTVSRIGPGSENPSGLAEGDPVFGVVRFGAYATEICAPLEQLFRVPRGVSVEQAGALPVASLTAFYALKQQGGVQPESRILVHSAAGGVGSQLVQMGKLLGKKVVGVVGAPHKVEAVRQLGADAVIDKSQENLFEAAHRHCPEGYDLVFDANGAETLRGSYAALRPTGRLVVYGAHTMLSRGSGRPNWLKLAWDYLRTPRFDPLRLTNENKSVMAFNLSYLFEEKSLLREAMLQISDWYSQEKLTPLPLTPLPFSSVQEAHALLQEGKTVGKLTLVPEPAMTSSTS